MTAWLPVDSVRVLKALARLRREPTDQVMRALLMEVLDEAAADPRVIKELEDERAAEERQARIERSRLSLAWSNGRRLDQERGTG
jgi:hypothetical protein